MARIGGQTRGVRSVPSHKTRPEWNVNEFHFDIRLRVGDRLIFIETLLNYDDSNDPDDPVIRVVSIHDA